MLSSNSQTNERKPSSSSTTKIPPPGSLLTPLPLSAASLLTDSPYFFKPTLRRLYNGSRKTKIQEFQTISQASRFLSSLWRALRTGTSAGEGSCGQTRESGDGRTKTSALNGPDARL